MKKFLNKFTHRFKTQNFWLRLLCGVCFGVAFPPVNFYPLIFIGVALLIQQIIECRGYNEVLRRTYAVFFWFNLIAVSWVCLSGFRHGADRFLIIAGALTLIAHPMFFWIPAAAFYKIFKTVQLFKHKNIYLISFPFIWVSFEYLHTLTQFSFPWLTFGNTQTYNLSKIQFIEYTGVYGLSFWICIIGVLVFLLMKEIQRTRLKSLFSKTIVLAVLIFALYFAPDIYSIIKNSQENYSNIFPAGELNVGVVQPDANPWERWGGKQMQYVNDYVDLIKILKEKNPQIQLIVMPETAITFAILHDIYYEKYLKFKQLVDTINTPLLIGLPYYKIYKDSLEAPSDAKRGLSGGFYDTYNAAALFEKGKRPDEYQIYKKNKLVIGAERIPYQETLGFLKDYVTWQVGISQWQIGKDTVNFVLDSGVQFNSAICYESVYPSYFAKFVEKGADFCTIITNDGWWGKLSGTYQHNQYAILRAVENRRWIVRSANTGISEFIDPYGNKYNETAINERASFAGRIGIVKEKTFYTLHPDLLCKASLYISIIILAGCISAGFIKQKSRG